MTKARTKGEIVESKKEERKKQKDKKEEREKTNIPTRKIMQAPDKPKKEKCLLNNHETSKITKIIITKKEKSETKNKKKRDQEAQKEITPTLNQN